MALKKCKECGNDISTAAKSCPNCGSPQGPKQYGLGSLVLLLIVGVVIYSIATADRTSPSSSYSTSPSAPATQSQPVTRVGDDVVLRVSSGDVVVCANESAYREFLKLAVAKDYLGMAQMEAAGRLFRVPSGTKAKIISSGFEKREVRIMEGAAFGRSGWVTESITR